MLVPVESYLLAHSCLSLSMWWWGLQDGAAGDRGGWLSLLSAYPFPSVSLQVVMVLKKEVMKTQNRELDKGPEYRQLLVQVGCAVCVICVNLPLQAFYW